MRCALALLLLVVGVADQAEQTSESKTTAWDHFLYCKCGLTCATQKGSWYIFQIEQSCACAACSNATALRGSPTQSQPSGMSQSEETGTSDMGDAALKSLPVDVPDDESWDSAHVPGSKVLYCALPFEALVYHTG